MITFEQIYELEPYIRKCCSNICDDKYRVDEAIADTYLWLCERDNKSGLDFLDWKGQPNKHYLRLIAQSKLLDRIKYDKRRKQREQITAHEPIELFDSDWEELEQSEPYIDAVNLVQIINEEPRYYQELIKLVYFRKVKQKDLSELLDIPYITLKQDVRKARESIKARFEERPKQESHERRRSLKRRLNQVSLLRLVQNTPAQQLTTQRLRISETQ